MATYSAKMRRRGFHKTCEHFSKFEPKKIVGIDLSTGETGLVVMDNHTRILKSVSWKKDPSHCYKERFQSLHNFFVENIPYDVDVIGYEAVTVFKSPIAAKSLAMCLGALYIAIGHITSKHVNIVPLTTSQIKKIATGKGKGDKNLVLLEIFYRYGEKFDSDDQADAFCAALGANDFFKMCSDYTKKNESYSDSLVSSFLKDGEGLDPRTFEVVTSVAMPNTSGKISVLQENEYQVYMDVRSFMQEEG